jgi:WD40 repeat protein
MFDGSMVAQMMRSDGRPERWRRQGRPVGLAIVTWPTVALLGATVATAACLLGDCDRHKQPAPRETLLGHAGMIKSIAFRPDGELLSSIGGDGSILVWDLETRPRHRFFPAGDGRVRSAAFSPDSKVVAIGNVTTAVTLAEFDVRQSRSLHDVTAGSAGAACLAFAPDGATLVVGQQDGSITLWDVASGRNRSTLSGHTNFVASLSVAPDGATLASAGGDRSVRIWDLPTGRERLALATATSTFVATTFSPDGRLLALADQVSPFVWLWDLTTGEKRAVLRGASGAVLTVAISPDGRTLAAADFQGVVTFWDLETLTKRPKRFRHAGVRTLAFAPDGRAVATGGFDGTIRIWDFPTSSAEDRLAPTFAVTARRSVPAPIN